MKSEVSNEPGKKRLAVLTGGGDCPGLNAVIRAVVKTALNNGYDIFGIENGFNGLVTGRMGLMTYKDVSGILPRRWDDPGNDPTATTLLSLQ